jgi:hypothetical protein
VKLLQYADEHWLIGDDAAKALVDYAIALANDGRADSVDIRMLNPTGREQIVSLLVGPATMLTLTDSDSEANEPDNAAAVAMMLERTRQLTTPPTAQPFEQTSYASDYEI